jgi:hypothetical protein
MGSYSYFETEDIEVKDWDGLKLFLKKWAEHYPDSWINREKIHSDLQDYSMLQTIKDDKGVEKEIFTFENWDNIKLISYWYPEILLFLELVAPYIEGRVDWHFENKDEAGYIEFSDNKCEITTGQMNWNSWYANENTDIEKNIHGITPDKEYKIIPEELFKLKLASCMDK